MQELKLFMSRMSSGRWILTVLSGVSFLILVLAYVMKGKEFSIAPSAITAIITMVFMSYFNKDRKNGGAS